ncbi:MAG: glycosyltransferase family 4 protein [Firmicutes bacterium]|nr:glycosyltransferase family 4 protein [Candidatus Colivicinus equi]
MIYLMMMKALVVTDLSFPTGSAMASRIKSFCMLFKDLGYDVHIIAAKTDNDHKTDIIYREKNYSFEIVKSNRSEQIQSFVGNENLLSKVEEYLSNNIVEFAFFNSLGALFNDVLELCKKHKVKTILEQCEWYDVSNFRFKDLDPRYIRFNKNIKNNFSKVDGIISISRLLNDYYLSLGAKSIRIPSIFDVENSIYNTGLNNKNVKLIYTGSVGKSKEFLKPVLEAMLGYENITLDIYGLTKDKLLSNLDNDEGLLHKLGDRVIIHKWVSTNELYEAISNSNYQIFIKPERRSSNAQFPTKLTESMSFGTPVICNNTGDIGLYIKDKENGFICDANNVSQTFDAISKLTNEEYNKLRVNARNTALKYFDYRNYIQDVRKLIEEL